MSCTGRARGPLVKAADRPLAQALWHLRMLRNHVQERVCFSRRCSGCYRLRLRRARLCRVHALIGLSRGRACLRGRHL
jgi:hypothetical protein